MSISNLFRVNDLPTEREFLKKCVIKSFEKADNQEGKLDKSDVIHPFSAARYTSTYSRYSRTLSILDFYKGLSDYVDEDDADVFVEAINRGFVFGLEECKEDDDVVKRFERGLAPCIQILEDYKANMGKPRRPLRHEAISILVDYHERLASLDSPPHYNKTGLPSETSE